MGTKKTILLISDSMHPFIKRDLEILSRHYDTDVFLYTSTSDRWKLIKEVRSHDINISWFILGYSNIAVKASRLVGKKSVLIAGGYDVFSIPELNYGYTLNPKRRKRLMYNLTRWVL